MKRIQFARRSVAALLAGSIALSACAMPPANGRELSPEVTATTIAPTAVPTGSTATAIPTRPATGSERPVNDGHPHVPESRQAMQVALEHLGDTGVDFQPASLSVDGIESDYARVSSLLNGSGEPYLTFLQRNEAGWQVIMDADLAYFALNPARIGRAGVPESLWSDLVTPAPLPTEQPESEQPSDEEAIKLVVERFIAEEGRINGPFSIDIDGIELDYARATVVPEAATEPGLVFLQRVADAWTVVVVGSPLQLSFDQSELIERGFPESLYADLIEAPASDEEAIRLTVDQPLSADLHELCALGIPRTLFGDIPRG